MFATVMRYGHIYRRYRIGVGVVLRNTEIGCIRRFLLGLDGKMHSVTSKVVRTKMCDAVIRLVVIRTRPKGGKPYRYFCVFTTDLTLEISQIIVYYRQRWQ